MGKPEDIKRLYNQMNNETKTLIRNVTQLIYFMRGSVSYDKAMYAMTYVEREIIMDYISDRLKEEAKSTHPVY